MIPPMAPLRDPPPWWDWELELSAHVEQRMEERGVTEVELRRMLEQAVAVREGEVEGRFIAEARHGGKLWAVVLEPDVELECVAVVTVYNTEEP